MAGYVELEEQYNWMPVDKQYAEAEIPDELLGQLAKAISDYQLACAEINAYISANPSATISDNI